MTDDDHVDEQEDGFTQEGFAAEPIIPARVIETPPLASVFEMVTPEHTEPSADALAAAHGARRFRPQFADAEVKEALDRAAVAGGWYISIHTLQDGQIHHWFKPSDKFPIADVAKCAKAVGEDAAKRLRAQRDAAEAGLAGLQGVSDAPRTFTDEND